MPIKIALVYDPEHVFGVGYALATLLRGIYETKASSVEKPINNNISD